MPPSAVRRALRQQRQQRQRRQRQQQQVPDVPIVEDERAAQFERMREWPLHVKIGNISFQYLNPEYIMETLEYFHPAVNTLTETQFNELVHLIQQDRIGGTICTVSCARADGEIITEENLLEFLQRVRPNYALMGVEFFYPMFRKLLECDPNSEKRIIFNSCCEIERYIRSCGL